MKARVKETGEIVDENAMVSFQGDDFYLDELEAIIDETEKIYDELDEVYWKNLEHQYAGMAMQGILSNPESELDYKNDETLPQALAGCAAKVATALVETLKNE